MPNIVIRGVPLGESVSVAGLEIKNDPKTLTADQIETLKAEGYKFVPAIAADADGNWIDWKSMSDSDLDKAEADLSRRSLIQAERISSAVATKPKIDFSDQELLELDVAFEGMTPQNDYRRSALRRDQ